MKTIAIAFALAAIAGSVHAAPVSATISAYNMSRIHEVAIGTVTSQAGETLNDFLLNGVRPELRAFTDRTDFEGCGEIAYNPSTKTYAVMLASSQSHLACAIHPGQVPAGYDALNITIHSHGKAEPFPMNTADRIFAGMQLDSAQSSLVARTTNTSRPPTSLAVRATWQRRPLFVTRTATHNPNATSNTPPVRIIHETRTEPVEETRG